MRRFYFLLLTCLSLIFNLNSNENTQIERRAGFRLTQDHVEVLVADVDTKENKISKILFTEQIEIPFKSDLGRNYKKKSFTDKLIDDAVKALKTLMEKAKAHHPKASQGFAASFFENAKNYQEFLAKIKKEVGLYISLLSAKQEGIIEFLSVIEKTHANPEDTLTWNYSWDVMRLTTKCGDSYSFFETKEGHHLITRIFKIVNVNPAHSGFPTILTKEQAAKEIQLIKDSIQDVPPCMREKASSSKITVIDFGVHPRNLSDKKDQYTREDLDRLIQGRVGEWKEESKKRDRINYPFANMQNIYGYPLSDLIMTKGIMDALNIEKVSVLNEEVDPTIGFLLYTPLWNTNTP